MKILLVNDYEKGGGAEQVCQQMYRLFTEDTSTVECFYGAASNEESATTALSYIYSNYQARRLKATLQRFQPDIVHVLNYYHVLSPAVILTLARWKRRMPHMKVVYTAHDFHLIAPNSGLQHFKRDTNHFSNVTPKQLDWRTLLGNRWDHRGELYSVLKLIQWILANKILRVARVFDHIITPSEFMAEALRAVVSTQITVVRNSCNCEVQETTIPSKPMKLIFIGRIAPEKGLSTFLANISAHDLKGMTLDIYGEGPDTDKIRLTIKQRDLSASVKMQGALPHRQLQAKLPQYHAQLMPSLWYENAPLSMVEAAHAGLYLLHSPLGGMQELATLCGGGIAFDTASTNSITAMLEQLRNTLDNHSRPHRNIRKVQHIFSEQHFTFSHIKIYQQLL